ncbi:MAG: alpha-amylase, partial [Treponema sp.]|nr:alpha-amylase [Treponema sp.]
LYAGKFTAVATGSEKVSSWQMKNSEETAFVMVNVTGDSVAVNIPEDYKMLKAVFCSNKEETQLSENTVTIPAFATVILADKQ